LGRHWADLEPRYGAVLGAALRINGRHFYVFSGKIAYY